MARILVLENELETRSALTEQLQRLGHSVLAVDSLRDGMEALANQKLEIFLAATELPDGNLLDWLDETSVGEARPIIIAMCEAAHWEKAGACLEKGAFDYISKPISAGQLNLALSRAEHALKWRRFGQCASTYSQGESLPLLIGRSDAVEALRQTVRKTSHSRASILIQGEYGAGQTEAAMALASNMDQNVVRFDCAAYPDGEIETVLFGSKETGVPGALELAHGGTMVLENASLLSWTAQALLLEFLKRGEIGSTSGPRKLDVRVIATVQENLLQKVRHGEFREELLYALNILPVAVPTLRERREDIPALAEIFRQRQVRKTGSGVLAIGPRALSALQDYPWPGNLAELRMVIERAVVLCGEGVIEMPHLCLTASVSPAAAQSASLESLADLERRHILQVLEKCDGNRMRTAETLGISIRTLRNKLKEYRTLGIAEQEPEAACA
ncbi:MAG: putative response regulator in two-component reguatory system, sigma54 dependent transcriptional [Verrucomicrobiales bacterium]|nr:putative response regulator in two-component reguatory system, sigma54 dependent transcriptional [Verrucomicrobiales bacterium]